MKRQLLYVLALSASVMVPTALPAAAQSVPSPQSYDAPATVIPQSTALTVVFPANLTIDAKKEQDYPTTLLLAQPLFDSYGNQIAAQNSPVSARIRPVKDGAQVIAESIVIQGRTVPIQATSPVLPSRKVTLSNGTDEAKALSPVAGRIGGGLFGGLNGGDPMQFSQGAMLGSGIGAIAGLASGKSVHIVEIPQGSLYVLTLQTAVALSTPPAPVAATPASAPTAPRFGFRTEQEYQAGLDKILQSYQQRQMSQADALNIIRAANDYATTQLPAPLYPPVQQRQLISQVFGFRYAIDSNTPAVNTASNGSQVLF
ncbi:hypothetical protein [Altericista sp. CCNU0014]|uniref:hypothetical protein n=1 Tax=Altericista sp. CCNU0014 TaxID=3082949 RepID=UPI00384B2A1D